MELFSRSPSLPAAFLAALLLLTVPTAGAQPLSRLGGVVEVSASGYSPSVAASEDGSFLVAWDEGVYGSTVGRILGRLYSPDAVPEGPAFVIAEGAGSGSPWVARLDGGGYVVVWAQEAGPSGAVFGRMLSATGLPLGEELVIDGSIPSLDGLQIVKSRPGGGFVVAWGHGDEMIQVRVFAESGAPLTPAVSTGLGWHCHSLSVASDGTFFVAGGNGTLFARRFGSEGQPFGEPFQISPTPRTGPEILTDGSHCPTVDQADDGTVLLSWKHEYVELTSTYRDWRELRLLESPSSPPGPLREAGPGFGGVSWIDASETVRLDSSGGELAALERCGDTGAASCLRLYSPEGSPLSRPFELPSVRPYGHRPSVETTADGSLLIAAADGGLGIRLFRFSLGERVAPRAAFRWEPREPVAGEEVALFDRSPGSPASWSWDFDGDGSEDSTARVPLHVFTAPGPHAVTLEVSNAYGQDRVTRTVTVEPTDDLPHVTAVKWQYPGFFLAGTSLSNTLEVEVEWRGSPGSVAFSVDGGGEVVEAAAEGGAAHDFDMGGGFAPSFSPSTVTVTPTNGEGVAGSPLRLPFFVFPYPGWLQAALAVGRQGTGLSVDVEGGEVRWSLVVRHPEPPLEAGVEVPSWVPIFGGPIGLEQTFFELEGSVSSRGEGSLGIAGQALFRAGDDSLSGRVEGRGDFRLAPPDGLVLNTATVGLDLAGTLAKPVALDEVPGVESAKSLPVVGGTVRRIAESGRLLGEISPSLATQTSFRQDQGELRFDDASGRLGLDLKAVVEVEPPGDRLEVRAWVGGGGSFTLGFPEPYLRAFEGHMEVGGRLQLDALFEVDAQLGARYSCGWSAELGTDCADDSGESPAVAVGAEAAGTRRVSVLQPEYEEHGTYAAFATRGVVEAASSPAEGPGVLVENVFAGASPELVEVGGGWLLLWEHQDLDDPVLQSTEILWSLDDGTGWSQPAPIVDDTRVELSPVAGRDATGRVVAAWLRVANPAFTGPVEEASDLERFYQQLEVVTAVFDPATGSWTPPVPLTADQALDTDLRLVASPSGDVLLTWLRNPGSEILSTATSPSTLIYAFWDASSSSWTTPAAVAGGLVGVGAHASAVARADEALVAVSRDPATATAGDDLLETYTWTGSGWVGPEVFAASAGGDRAPRVAYGLGGDAHLVWLRGGALVHATTADPTPVVVEPEAGEITSLDSELLAGDDGTMVLLGQELRVNGAASLVAHVFDPVAELWSKSLPLLTADEVLHREIHGRFGSDGDLHLTYLATSIERVEEDVTLDGEQVTIPNLPRDGRTDLVTLRRRLRRDLTARAGGLTVEPDVVTGGVPVAAAVEVRNSGDLTVTGFEVDFRVGAADQSGILVAAVPVAEPLAAGESITVEASFAWPAEGGVLYAVVDALDAVEEASENDNVASYRVGDLAPIAVATLDHTRGRTPLSVAYDASESFDPEGGELSYRWTFGDGSAAQPGARGTHVFSSPGTYPVTLTVVDPLGHPAAAEVTVTVDGEGCPVADSLELARQLVLSPRTFEACSFIETGEGFRMEAGADVVFRAGEAVALGSGFRMDAGAVVRVVIDPALQP